MERDASAFPAFLRAATRQVRAIKLQDGRTEQRRGRSRPHRHGAHHDAAGQCHRVGHGHRDRRRSSIRRRPSPELSPDAEILNRLPVRRDIYSATRFAAGVVDDAVGPTVYGSSGAENQYIIDGLNTTGVELGNKGKNVNMDFIEQVETKTGGLPAEYGRNTGGIVNAITKSGSNMFRGSLFGFTEGGFLSRRRFDTRRSSADDHPGRGYLSPRRRRRNARRVHRQGSPVVLWLDRLRGRGLDTTVIRDDRLPRESRHQLGHSVDHQEHAFRGQADLQARHRVTP